VTFVSLRTVRRLCLPGSTLFLRGLLGLARLVRARLPHSMREVLRILNKNWLRQASMRGGSQRCRSGGTHYDPRGAGEQNDADRCHGLPFSFASPRKSLEQSSAIALEEASGN